MLRFVWRVLILTLVFTTRAHARDINVPADQPTIQAGIDVSATGDRVIVAQGTYFERAIDFRGKAITVQSTNPSLPEIVAATIVHGGNAGTVFWFHTGESAASLLDGFTITGGNNTNVWPNDGGGGVTCKGSSPTVSRCYISRNRTTASGGGIHCYNSNAVIADCRVTANDAPDGAGISCRNMAPSITGTLVSANIATNNGGGFYCYYANPTIDYCIVTADSANYGAGIYAFHSNGMISNSTIAQNNVQSYGGGFYCTDSSNPAIQDCTISENSASSGGGMYCNQSSPSMLRCDVERNAAASYGGGLFGDNSRAMLTECVIRLNTSDYSAGGMYLSSSSPILNSCEISENVASRDGGGIYWYQTTTGEVNDCTIQQNTATEEGGGIYVADGASPTFRQSVISNNVSETSDGGGLWAVSTRFVLEDCIISQNVSGSSGAGIYLYYSSPTIEDCTISDNTSNSHGGGIYLIGSSSSLKRCDVTNNVAIAQDARGGGIYLGNSSANLDACFILNNGAFESGGGAYITGTSRSPSITNCVFAGNIADFGAGVYIWNAQPSLYHCTIVANNALDGGGLWSSDEIQVPYVHNSILWANTPNQIYNPAVDVLPIDIQYSDIQGGWSGTGNINADPLLVDLNAGDYHLSSASPCRDKGITGYASFDFDGDARPWGISSDMGADEYVGINQGVVRGVIRDKSTNSPLADVRMELSQNFIPHAITTTASDGTYGLIAGAGTYALHAQHPGFLQSAKDVTIVADNTTTADLSLDHWPYITHVDVPGMGPGSTGDITVHIRVDQEGDYTLTKPVRRTIHCVRGADNTITFTGVAENRGYLAEVPLQLKSGATTVDSEKLRIPVDLASPLTPAEDAALAAKHAPVLGLGNEEVYQPKGAIPTLEVSNLFVMDGVLPKLFNGPVNPLLLDTHFFRDGRTDIASPNHKAVYNARISQTPNTVYARVVEENGRLFVFYWLHYFVSNWDEHGGANFHEGDWEGLAVELTLGQTPVQVGFSQHFRLAWYEGGDRRPWNGVETVGDHVVGYVSEGSHSTYPYAGVDWIEGFGNDVHEGDGVELLPDDLFTGVDGTEPYTLMILPRLDETWENRAPDMEWVRYTGAWGQLGVPGFSGAAAPVMSDRWFTPIEWIDNLDTSLGERPMGPPTGELHVID